MFVPEEHSQFVHQIGPATVAELRTSMRRGDDQRDIVIKEFSQLGNSVADDVVKQLSR